MRFSRAKMALRYKQELAAAGDNRPARTARPAQLPKVAEQLDGR